MFEFQAKVKFDEFGVVLPTSTQKNCVLCKEWKQAGNFHGFPWN